MQRGHVAYAIHTPNQNAQSTNELLLRLTERLARKNLKPYDVGGSGDCFFKSVSHQLFGTADRHLEIRLAGVNNLVAHPEYYIEFSSHESWLDYLRMMSKLGSWCDHITIQAVADVFNCTIDITESAFGFDETILIRPRAVQPQTRLIHIGHLDEMHYVSTIPLAQINFSNKEKQKIKRHQQYLSRKASETKEQRDKRLAQGNKYRQKMKNSNPGKNQTILNSVQTIASTVEKQKVKRHEQYLKRKASETKEQRDKRLAQGKKYRQKMKNSDLNSVENTACTSAVENQKVKRHEQYLKRKASETREQRDERLAQGRKYKSYRRKHNSYLKTIKHSKQGLNLNSKLHSCASTKPVSKEAYFSNFDTSKKMKFMNKHGQKKTLLISIIQFVILFFNVLCVVRYGQQVKNCKLLHKPAMFARDVRQIKTQ